MSAKKASNPIDKHVGSRVRMRRIMLGMSQEKLGEALRLTFQQVQKYEKGANRIGAGRLQQISRILGVPVAFFFEGAPHVVGMPPLGEFDEAPSPSYVTDFLSTSDGLSLTEALCGFPAPSCVGAWSNWCRRWPLSRKPTRSPKMRNGTERAGPAARTMHAAGATHRRCTNSDLALCRRSKPASCRKAAHTAVA